MTTKKQIRRWRREERKKRIEAFLKWALKPWNNEYDNYNFMVDTKNYHAE